ncbi:hypothetical protein PVAG01_10019 [Phlyctema vagabunda]|uniref:Uncharacterized protein n=1 Tax=Phlyctema vagabunda TaxID=108571 RepID=A0ABR4P4S4_9HELO
MASHLGDENGPKMTSAQYSDLDPFPAHTNSPPPTYTTTTHTKHPTTTMTHQEVPNNLERQGQDYRGGFVVHVNGIHVDGIRLDGLEFHFDAGRLLSQCLSTKPHLIAFLALLASVVALAHSYFSKA